LRKVKWREDGNWGVGGGERERKRVVERKGTKGSVRVVQAIV